MIDLTGRHVDIVYDDFRAGEVRASLADIRRARAELSFEPQSGLRGGLETMWRGIQGGVALTQSHAKT
jgi:nucleoside-diphosphate-sugar epimerase